MGQFGSLPARVANNEYQVAAGHNRLEAAKRLGLKVVDLNVQEYDDE